MGVVGRWALGLVVGWSVAALGLGLWGLWKGAGPNRCGMTYMYQVPRFLEVPLPASAARDFPRYRLMAYGEGHYAKRLAEWQLTGVPVLFVPGNAGSYRQVRSLGSISLMKTAMSRGGRAAEFNYFSLDLDEELSGLYGGFAWNHTRFLQLALQHVFALYKAAPRPPTSVVLVGHSVGGLVARGVFLLPGFQARQVSLLVTLATPHRGPVLNLDSGLGMYQGMVEKWWAAEAGKRLAHLSAVSVGGGAADLLVRSAVTAWPEALRSHLKPSLAQLSLWEQSGEGMDKLWAGMDHLCIVWCNQLNMELTRALFDAVDPATQQLVTDRRRLHAILDWHFGNRGRGPNSLHLAAPEGSRDFPRLEIRPLDVTLGRAKVYSTSPKSLPTVLYKTLVTRDMVGKGLFVQTDQAADVVALVCHEEEGCSSATPVPGHRLAPPANLVQHIRLDAGLLGRSLVLPTTFHSPKRHLVSLLYDPEDPDLSGSVRLGWSDFLCPWLEHRGQLEGKAFYNLTLEGHSSVAQVYTLRLEGGECSDGDGRHSLLTSVRVSFDGAVEDAAERHFRIPYNASDDFVLRRLVPQEGSRALLQFRLSPDCGYTLSLRASPVMALGEVLRHWAPGLPSLLGVELLCLLALLDSSQLWRAGPRGLGALEGLGAVSLLALYHFLLLVSSSQKGMGVVVAAALATLTTGLLSAFLGTAALLHSLLSRLGRPQVLKKAAAKPRRGLLGSSVGVSEVRLSVAGAAGVSLLLDWRLPGQPLLVVALAVQVVAFGRSALGVRSMSPARGGFEAQLHSVALALGVLEAFVLAPSLVVWLKSVLESPAAVLEALAIDPARSPVLLFAVASSVFLPHQRLCPWRFGVTAALAIAAGARDSAAPLSSLCQAMAVPLGLVLNAAWAPPIGPAREERRTEAGKNKSH